MSLTNSFITPGAFTFSENEKLREDLQKVEQLEDKINTELVMLREKIDTMEKELVTFRDIGSLKQQSEEKKEVSGCFMSHEKTRFSEDKTGADINWPVQSQKKAERQQFQS